MSSHTRNRPFRRLPAAFVPAAVLLLTVAGTAKADDAPTPAGGIEDRVLAAKPVVRDAPAAPASADAAPVVSDLGISLHPAPGTPAEPAAAPPAPHVANTPPASDTAPAVPAGRATDVIVTPAYTYVPMEQRDIGTYNRPRQGVGATIEMSAGTGGMFNTGGSVTLPLIDNQLTLRLSGSKGSGYPYGGLDGGIGGSYDGGRYTRAVDGSSYGFDLLWTPSDAIRINAQGTQSSGRYNSKNH